MSRFFRLHLFIAALSALVLGAPASPAQDFPSKPIRIIVPDFQERNLPAIAAEVDDALAQAGRRKFILAPGCTLACFSPKRSLAFLRDYTRKL